MPASSLEWKSAAAHLLVWNWAHWVCLVLFSNLACGGPCFQAICRQKRLLALGLGETPALLKPGSRFVCGLRQIDRAGDSKHDAALAGELGVCMVEV